MKEKHFSSKLIILAIILFTCLFIFPASSLALIPGDFGSADNGPPDGCVDFEDLMIFALAYGSTPSDANWNEACDIASEGGILQPDGVIDFEDLMIFAMHYGECSLPDWIGIPQLDPDTIFTEEVTDVRIIILVNCKPEDLASESAVDIFAQNENSEWVLLDEMFDDGDLISHGDEIKGDRIYSNIFGFYKENETIILLKIVVTTLDDTQYTVEFNLNVVEDISEEIYQEVNEISNLSEQKLSEIMQAPPPDIAAVIQTLSDYLVEQADVESCEILDNTLELTFDTGLLMEIELINLDAGEPPAGESLPTLQEGLKLSSNKNREGYTTIPLEEQTTGENISSYKLSKDSGYSLKSKDISEVEYIGNRSVFIWDPFYTYYSHWNFDAASEYEQILNNSGIDFNIDIYRDDKADIETLKIMADYGIIILHTHGSGKSLLTGEEPNETNISKYQDEMKPPRKIYIAQSIGVSWKWFGLVEVYGKRFGVTKDWFNSSNLPGEFPNSIIFNNSCKSNYYDYFYNAFDSLGAATYYGHSDLSWLEKSIPWTSEALEGLVDGKTTGDAYVERSHNWQWDGRTGTTTWDMEGKENVKISDEPEILTPEEIELIRKWGFGGGYVVRWPDGYVDVYDATNYSRMQEVINEWNSAIDGPVSLRLSSNPNSPVKVVFDWSLELENLCGRANWIWGDDYALSKVVIKIYPYCETYKYCLYLSMFNAVVGFNFWAEVSPCPFETWSNFNTIPDMIRTMVHALYKVPSGYYLGESKSKINQTSTVIEENIQLGTKGGCACNCMK